MTFDNIVFAAVLANPAFGKKIKVRILENHFLVTFKIGEKKTGYVQYKDNTFCMCINDDLSPKTNASGIIHALNAYARKETMKQISSK